MKTYMSIAVSIYLAVNVGSALKRMRNIRSFVDNAESLQAGFACLNTLFERCPVERLITAKYGSLLEEQRHIAPFYVTFKYIGCK